MTFRITVMCGNRLNAWNTIPIRRRTAFWSTPAAVISSPSTQMRPASTGSSRSMHRSSVDFPDPLAPIRPDDLMVLDHEVDIPQHLELAEGLADAFDAYGFGHGVAPACRRRRSRAINQSVSRAKGIVIRMNRNAATTKLE